MKQNSVTNSFCFVAKLSEFFLIDRLLLRKNSKVVKLYKIRRLTLYFYINDPRPGLFIIWYPEFHFVDV